MAIVIPLRVELEICAVICGSQIHYVNVWEEICVHASKYKKDCICRRYACTDRSGDCAWQCDRNEYPFFTGGGVLLCRDCDSGIWIEKRGRLFTGRNFAGNASVYAIDKELKATVTNYKNTDLVSVGGTNAKIVSPDPTTEETKATESTTKATQATTKETQTTTKATQATTKSTESATKATEKETTGSDATTSYDKTSLSYSGAYTDISKKKDADFKNAKYVSSSNEILNAISSAKAGDVIIVKGGTYKFSDTIVINNAMNGKSGSYIIVKAESGKEVKFDFSAQKLDGANRGVVVDGDYWYFQGINFYGAGDNGVLLAGNNNIFEKCVFEANRDSGLQISRYDTPAATKDLWPSNNLIINCTSHDNCDFPEQGGTGENADGFAAKLTCGEGNVFDGCISYSNSDDGWDLFAKSATGPIGVITIRNCVAFNNGTLSNGVHYANGDMNGFKLGGSGVGTPHNVMNCLSFDNGATGFTDNNNPTGLTIVNVTAWGNGKYAKKGNFLCYRTSSAAITSPPISGRKGG